MNHGNVRGNFNIYLFIYFSIINALVFQIVRNFTFQIHTSEYRKEIYLDVAFTRAKTFSPN